MRLELVLRGGAGDEETNSAAGWAAAECVAEATDSNVGAIIGGAGAGGAAFLCSS